MSTITKPYAEIGSEFWDVPQSKTAGRIFPETTQWFLSGRSALQAIIKELNGHYTVAMPSWCCDSMINPFLNAGMNVRFYPVYWDTGLVQEIRLDCDILFLMDYFGYTGTQPDISGYHGTVIRDVTHSFLSHSYSDADYFFGSLRKWCGIWTGGYAWTPHHRKLSTECSDTCGYIELRAKAMQYKENYINGTGVSDKRHLKLFSEAEDMLDNVGIAPAANRDVFLANNMDGEYIKKCRRENAEILRQAFSDWLIFPDMKETDCPMFVPLLVPDDQRDALRKYLIQHEIYCPVHWPAGNYHDLSQKTAHIYQNELSLVCDQRYTEKDMNRIVSTIHSFWKENR